MAAYTIVILFFPCLSRVTEPSAHYP